MKIADDHFYHGAALIQIAEYPQFKAINPLKLNRRVLRTAYKVNNDIGVYFKYARKPTKPYKEFCFTFHREHLKELSDISQAIDKLFLGLVCVTGKEICCLSYPQFNKLIQGRKKEKKADENQYTILVTIPEGKNMRVYVNPPGEKGKKLFEQKVPRNSFPAELFT
jgi:hypothetical protein